MTRKALSEAHCPVARSVDIVGDVWSLLIIRDLFDGLRRFTELQKNLGIAKNILATRLKSLVESGILSLGPASDGTAYQEYVLTERGKGLFSVIVGLRQWGETHAYRPGETRSVLVNRASNQPLRALEVRSSDGRLVGPDDVVVKKVGVVKAGARMQPRSKG
jgi:DNA-binding HxlR family transcriptional regulator